MCLILFAVDYPTGYRLIAAANRDEFYDRPTAALHFWPAAPYLAAGRDLRSGGTWMGVTRQGRFAALTNYRDPSTLRPEAPSRGGLVTDFLLGERDATAYLRHIASSAGRYNGFNLVLADDSGVYWTCNRTDGFKRLSQGIYGLSNRLLDTPWPKVEKAKAGFGRWMEKMEMERTEGLFKVLGDQTYPPEAMLPDTGVAHEWERRLSPVFITSSRYGTRSSTVLQWRTDGRIMVTERGFSPRSATDGDAPRVEFDREVRLWETSMRWPMKKA